MTRKIVKPASISEQAAGWLVELADGGRDRESRLEFIKWLKRSPQHIEAFLTISVLEQELAEHAGDMADVLADALAEVESASGNTAVPIDGAPPAAARRGRRRPAGVRWRLYGWAGAAASLLVVLAVTFWPDGEPPAVVHRTDFGEQRSIALSDGSIVTLNTHSELKVRFDDSTRRVELISGEAMFDVARDKSKPFIVETGDVSFSVLGTRFSVYRRPESVRVAVVEGVVRAESRRMPERAVLVGAGEGAIATPDGSIQRNEHIDVAKAIAWTERRLIFDEAPLSEVVREFNRYNRVPLVVVDSELAERRITSVFDANDVSALVGFLELEPDVDVDYGAQAIRIRLEK